jgi:hypothetical protein
MNLAGTSGLGKKFWNIKVKKKCRAKALRISTNAGPATPGRGPHPGSG